MARTTSGYETITKEWAILEFRTIDQKTWCVQVIAYQGRMHAHVCVNVCEGVFVYVCAYGVYVCARAHACARPWVRTPVLDTPRGVLEVSTLRHLHR